MERGKPKVPDFVGPTRQYGRRRGRGGRKSNGPNG